MSYVHITGERKNPARTKKLIRLSTSGILQEIGANIKPMAHPVNEINNNHKGSINKLTVTGRSCMKKNGMSEVREIKARAALVNVPLVAKTVFGTRANWKRLMELLRDLVEVVKERENNVHPMIPMTTFTE